MNYTLHSVCPHCSEPRITALELVNPERTVLIECACGEHFAVHLRASVALRTVPVPKADWGTVPLPHSLPVPKSKIA